MDSNEKRIMDAPFPERDEFGGGRVVNWWPLLILVERENGLFIETEFMPHEIPTVGRTGNGTRIRRAAHLLLGRGILPMTPGRVQPDDWPALRDLMFEHGVFENPATHGHTVTEEPGDVHV